MPEWAEIIGAVLVCTLAVGSAGVVVVHFANGMTVVEEKEAYSKVTQSLASFRPLGFLGIKPPQFDLDTRVADIFERLKLHDEDTVKILVDKPTPTLITYTASQTTPTINPSTTPSDHQILKFFLMVFVIVMATIGLAIVSTLIFQGCRASWNTFKISQQVDQWPAKDVGPFHTALDSHEPHADGTSIGQNHNQTELTRDVSHLSQEKYEEILTVVAEQARRLKEFESQEKKEIPETLPIKQSREPSPLPIGPSNVSNLMPTTSSIASQLQSPTPSPDLTAGKASVSKANLKAVAQGKPLETPITPTRTFQVAASSEGGSSADRVTIGTVTDAESEDSTITQSPTVESKATATSGNIQSAPLSKSGNAKLETKSEGTFSDNSSTALAQTQTSPKANASTTSSPSISTTLASAPTSSPSSVIAEAAAKIPEHTISTPEPASAFTPSPTATASAPSSTKLPITTSPPAGSKRWPDGKLEFQLLDKSWLDHTWNSLLKLGYSKNQARDTTIATEYPNPSKGDSGLHHPSHGDEIRDSWPPYPAFRAARALEDTSVVSSSTPKASSTQPQQLDPPQSAAIPPSPRPQPRRQNRDRGQDTKAMARESFQRVQERIAESKRREAEGSQEKK